MAPFAVSLSVEDDDRVVAGGLGLNDETTAHPLSSTVGHVVAQQKQQIAPECES